MRKSFCIILSLILMLLLCSCNGYADIDNKYIVSAMGFDFSEGEILVVAETISSNQNVNETQIFTARGKSAKEAVFRLGDHLTRSLVVDHCAILAIGKNIKQAAFQDIISFCLDVKNLNLGVKLVFCEDIENVFSTPVSQTAVGYGIWELLKIREKQDGIDYKNRFYEIRNSQKSSSQIFSLPCISTDSQTLILQGEQIYKNESPLLFLDNTESSIYALVCNRFTSGNVFIGKEFAHIYKSKTTTKKQSAVCKIRAKTHSSHFESALENAYDSLIKKAVGASAEDIFSKAPNKINFVLRREVYE